MHGMRGNMQSSTTSRCREMRIKAMKPIAFGCEFLIGSHLLAVKSFLRL